MRGNKVKLPTVRCTDCGQTVMISAHGVLWPHKCPHGIDCSQEILSIPIVCELCAARFGGVNENQRKERQRARRRENRGW